MRRSVYEMPILTGFNIIEIGLIGEGLNREGFDKKGVKIECLLHA